MQQLLDNRTEREIKRRERRDSEVTKRAFETKKKKKGWKVDRHGCN